jgi:hypothetical protein
VWDGRFEAVAARSGLTLRALAGMGSRLPPDERRRVRTLEARVRGALPVAEIDGVLRSPLAPPLPELRIAALAGDRLAAACGLIRREPD